jgi:hypothetical protein
MERRISRHLTRLRVGLAVRSGHGTRPTAWIARALGGHIKYAPDPGWLTLARGFEKLETLTKGWRAAKLQLGNDQR